MYMCRTAIQAIHIPSEIYVEETCITDEKQTFLEICVWETYIPRDMCAEETFITDGKHASLGICVWETRIPGKHISL